jgi:hypothetical protein
MSRTIKNALCTIIIINDLFFLARTLLILSNRPLGPEIHIPDLAVREGAEGIIWSRFAYSQYVTDTVYLCNSVMRFEAFNRLERNTERLLVYSSHFLPDINDKGT